MTWLKRWRYTSTKEQSTDKNADWERHRESIQSNSGHHRHAPHHSHPFPLFVTCSIHLSIVLHQSVLLSTPPSLYIHLSSTRLAALWPDFPLQQQAQRQSCSWVSVGFLLLVYIIWVIFWIMCLPLTALKHDCVQLMDTCLTWCSRERLLAGRTTGLCSAVMSAVNMCCAHRSVVNVSVVCVWVCVCVFV